MKTNLPTQAYPFLTLPVDVAALVAMHAKVQAFGVSYKMGAKPQLNAEPCTFTKSDCSGWVRWLLNRQGLLLPDGSANQHDAIRQAKIVTAVFKKSTEDALNAKDGALRVAFLPPIGDEAGHVALWHDGLSMECHGDGGVDRRTVEQCAHWLAHCEIFVLTAPVAH